MLYWVWHNQGPSVLKGYDFWDSQLIHIRSTLKFLHQQPALSEVVIWKKNSQKRHTTTVNQPIYYI